MTIDWGFVLKIIPVLLKASLITLEAVILGYTMALIAGLALALLRRSKSRLVSQVTGWFVEFIRSTPLLIQLYFMYFVLPEVGIRLPALLTGILGLGLHYSSYTSEVYRSGLEGVAKGQWEAARALNYPPVLLYRRIIIPQAVPRIIPAMGNYLVGIIKDSPLMSAIAVVEIMQRAKIIGSETFRYLEPISLVGLYFLALSLLFAFLIRRTERALSLSRKIAKEERKKKHGTDH